MENKIYQMIDENNKDIPPFKFKKKKKRKSLYIVILSTIATFAVCLFILLPSLVFERSLNNNNEFSNAISNNEVIQDNSKDFNNETENSVFSENAVSYNESSSSEENSESINLTTSF